MNQTNRNGVLALLVLAGGVLLYRNRASIQRFLESRGIETPLDRTGGIFDTIKSGIARLAGRTEYALDRSDSEIQKTG